MNRVYHGMLRLWSWVCSPSLSKTRLVFYVLGLAWLVFHVPRQHSTHMNNFSSELRTHCLGRYLIDLPVDLGEGRVALAQLYFGLGSDFETVEIKVPKVQPSDFAGYWTQANQKALELASKKNDALLIPMLLEKRIIKTPNGDALMIRMLDDDYSDSATIMSELHAYVGGRYIILSGESYPPEENHPQYFRNSYKTIDPTPAEDRLMRIAEFMRPAGQPLGNRNGFCIAEVLFDSERMGYSEEKTNFAFETKNEEEPGLAFQIRMNGMRGYEAESLHDRTDRIGPMLLPFILQVVQRTVRRRTRKVEGVTFQEWGNEIYYRKGRTVFSFSIQNSRPAAQDLSFDRPAMTVDLDSGSDMVSSPYTLQQLEAGWDQWISTLRIAPGNGGKQR